MSAFTDWLLSDIRVPAAPNVTETHAEETRPWWQVMCLTGVDYFSSLGYAPGIAFLAAGADAPIATLVLVLVTLFAALPAYSRVAAASPRGQGSIAMLERLFPEWRGKLFVLVLLGFATTDFVITITLSAADGAAHLAQNPYWPHPLNNQMGITLAILVLLAAIFLKGFREAITIAVVLVVSYLALNAVVMFVAFGEILRHPAVFARWRDALFHAHSSPLALIGVAIILFPRLALGLSGFETGVAVMPLIAACDLGERVRNTRRLLLSAAVIMSAFLLVSSLATTLLIPAREFRDGGHANGRAIAFIAHRYLGDAFGSAYDFSTILILGFAGASAMAGLLNLVPRYLPRFGMAPDWARASRPLVFVFLAVSVLVTLAFHASVDAQGGAYATGVLVLMTSAACAVALSLRKTPSIYAFAFIAAIFVYTTLMNMWERPEGIRISSIFIAVIIVTSLLSRAIRSTELRINRVRFDDEAESIIAQQPPHDPVHLVARRLSGAPVQDYGELEECIREAHGLHGNEPLIFVEIQRGDVSEFDFDLAVAGRRTGAHCVLHAEAPALPNAVAAILIEIGKRTGQRANVYFTWPQGNPLFLTLRFLFLGDGYTAPLTHEILREAVPDPAQRPLVHVV